MRENNLTFVWPLTCVFTSMSCTHIWALQAASVWVFKATVRFIQSFNHCTVIRRTFKSKAYVCVHAYVYVCELDSSAMWLPVFITVFTTCLWSADYLQSQVCKKQLYSEFCVCGLGSQLHYSAVVIFYFLNSLFPQFNLPLHTMCSWLWKHKRPLFSLRSSCFNF